MKLSAIMTLNNSGFTNPLAGAQSAMRGAIGGLAALAGASVSVAGVLAGVKRALDFGGELSDLSAVTGTSVGELVVLRQAFEDTGVGAASVQPILGFMQRSLSGMNEEGGKTSDTFKALGLDMGQLRGMAPTAAMQTISKAIGKLGTESDKTAATMAIFGRGGAMLKSFFSDPGAIDTARKSLGGLPAIMERNAALFDSVSDSIGRLKAKGMGLFAGIAEGVLPAVSGMKEAFDNLDLSGFGQRVGDIIATTVQLFRDGKIGEVLGLSLKIAFKENINLFASNMERVGVAVLAIFSNAGLWQGVWDMVAGGLQGAFSGLVGVLMKVFSAPIVYLRTSMDKIMGTMFEWIGKGINNLQTSMDKVMGTMFEWIGKIPGIGKVLGLEGFKAKTTAEYAAENEKNPVGISKALGLNGFQAKTIDEYMAENEKSEKDTSDAFMGASKSSFARAGDGMATAAAGAREVMDTVMAVEPKKIFDADAEKAELAGLWNSVNAKTAEARSAMQKAAAPQKPATAGEPTALTKQADAGKYEVKSDALSKIGLYIGGAGALSDPMRRVATNTERQVRLLEQLAQTLAERPSASMLPA